MGRLVNQARPLGGLGLFVLSIAVLCAVGKGNPHWIKAIPDGLDLHTDEHCFVIAGEWVVLVSIDELTPPPELLCFLNDLQTAIRRHSLLTQYAYGWLMRLTNLRKTIQNPRQWWRTDQSPLHISRPKRGLVDAVGHAFKFLFGTATDDEIKDIQRAVDALAESQWRMVTLMNEFTTVVNHTYDEVQANRNQINRLTTSIQSLTGRLNSEFSFLHQCLYGSMSAVWTLN